ncbi:MAG: hypothetical protein ACRDGM_02555 [bacterium]
MPPATGTCDFCGQAFVSRREDHRWCSAGCRLRGFALAKLREREEALRAVDTIRAWLIHEIARWKATAAGRPPRRE